MSLDIELYRRSIDAPVGRHGQKLRRISAIDIQPVGATRTLVLVHGYGGSATQWLYQLDEHISRDCGNTCALAYNTH